MMTKKIIIFIVTIFISFFGHSQTKNGWTIMHYSAGSNSSEIDLLSDINEMIVGKKSSGYEVISLIDRIAGFSEDSTTLGENFTDTRLFRFHSSKFEELDGQELLPEMKLNTSYEANMGDANLLKRFIQYCKQNYPANNYMLVLRSHGNGLSMCADVESEVVDRLYTGELRDVLTNEESVDILGLDVCSMAGLENFYEWRPDSKGFSAKYIIASAPLSAAWAYDQIFNRLEINPTTKIEGESNYFNTGIEQNLDPFTMTPLQFSELLMEEIYDSQRWASWGLFDNEIIIDLKNAIDKLAVLLVEEDKNKMYDLIENTLSYHHNTNQNVEVAQLTFPYVDAFAFAETIATNESFSQPTRSQAKQVADLIDKMVLMSYHGNGYFPDVTGFKNGSHGAYLILPRGNKIFPQTNRTFWAHTNWFGPTDQREAENSYGLYDWCIDGAEEGNNKVENFYEYLDFLFDSTNDDGGVNKYSW